MSRKLAPFVYREPVDNGPELITNTQKNLTEKVDEYDKYGHNTFKVVTDPHLTVFSHPKKLSKKDLREIFYSTPDKHDQPITLSIAMPDYIKDGCGRMGVILLLAEADNEDYEKYQEEQTRYRRLFEKVTGLSTFHKEPHVTLGSVGLSLATDELLESIAIPVGTNITFGNKQFNPGVDDLRRQPVGQVPPDYNFAQTNRDTDAEIRTVIQTPEDIRRNFQAMFAARSILQNAQG